MVKQKADKPIGTVKKVHKDGTADIEMNTEQLIRLLSSKSDLWAKFSFFVFDDEMEIYKNG